jgi:hypothetical protein
MTPPTVGQHRTAQIEARVRTAGAEGIDEQAGAEEKRLPRRRLTCDDHAVALDAVADKRVAVKKRRAGAHRALAQFIEQRLGVDDAVKDAAH